MSENEEVEYQEVDDDDIFGSSGRTLHIDGDILVYRPCCIFPEDNDTDRKLIGQNIDQTIAKMVTAAGVDSYEVFLTTKLNFRDHVTDDYKANRDDVERPVNLPWSKKHMVQTHGGVAVKYLEADDLLAIKHDENAIIWSLDKDLMQIPGWHLVDIIEERNGKRVTVDYELVYVEPLGHLEAIKVPKKPTKYKFSGFKGLMFQALIGDTADYIIGCGVRKEHTYKSGKKIGQKYMKRVGVGAAKAYDLLVNETCMPTMKDIVAKEYYKIFGDKWQDEMEKQMNLLYMVEDYDEDSGTIRQWTYDGRISRMHIETGEVYDPDKKQRHSEVS